MNATLNRSRKAAVSAGLALLVAACSGASAASNAPASSGAASSGVPSASKAAGASSGAGASGAAAGTPVYFGWSAPLTGQYAQYGQQFKEAFDLAVEQVNAAGGINGHPIQIKAEDSQSDPKQSVSVAQKFVNDPDVVLVFGDYSSAASIPASPIYTAGKLLQYGYNNSNPNFTAKGTQYQWSTSITTDASYTWTADYIKKAGVASVGVAYLNSADWGVPAFSAFKAEADKIGLTITDAEAIDPNSDDYRPSLTKAVAGSPQAFVEIGYGPDAAKAVTQLRAIGYKGTFYGGQDEETFNQTPDAEGSIVAAEFLPDNPAANVQAFVKAFRAKYPNEATVTGFEAGAYDALYVAVAAAKAGGTTRDGILAGFSQIKDVPSVVYGTITFDPATRRVASPQLTPIILKGGKWAQFGG
jgi:branched-chain amino acid transport system substrate-binding protein